MTNPTRVNWDDIKLAMDQLGLDWTDVSRIEIEFAELGVTVEYLERDSEGRLRIEGSEYVTKTVVLEVMF